MSTNTNTGANTERVQVFFYEWLNVKFNPWFKSISQGLNNTPTANTVVREYFRTVNAVLEDLAFYIAYVEHLKTQPSQYNLTQLNHLSLLTYIQEHLERERDKVIQSYENTLIRFGLNTTYKLVDIVKCTKLYQGSNASVFNWNGQDYNVKFGKFQNANTQTPVQKSPDATVINTDKSGRRCGFFCRLWGGVKTVINTVVPFSSIVTGGIDILLDLLDIVEIEDQKNASLVLSPNTERAVEQWAQNVFTPWYKNIAIALGSSSSAGVLSSPSYVGKINEAIKQLNVARAYYGELSKRPVSGLSTSESITYFQAIRKVLADGANSIATSYGEKLKQVGVTNIGVHVFEVNPSSIRTGIVNYTWVRSSMIKYNGFGQGVDIVLDKPNGTTHTNDQSKPGGTIPTKPTGDGSRPSQTLPPVENPNNNKRSFWPWLLVIGGGLYLGSRKNKNQ